jgi:hypothetical protein
MRILKFWMATLFLFATISSGFAQDDELEYVEYDVVYLKKGGGIKGEILAFDEKNGGIVFKDKDGRKYFIAQEEYDYFEENRRFPVKKKKSKQIHQRKKDAFEIGVGATLASLGRQHNVEDDETYIGRSETYPDQIIAFRVLAGKRFKNLSYAGLWGEIGLMQESNTSFSFGGRYSLLYNNKKETNLGLYIPLEVYYNYNSFDLDYSVKDTTFSDGGWSYPSYEKIKVSQNAVGLSVGHGFSFHISEQRSFALELMLFKHFIVSQNFEHNLPTDPKSDFNNSGIRFIISYNF